MARKKKEVKIWIARKEILGFSPGEPIPDDLVKNPGPLERMGTIQRVIESDVPDSGFFEELPPRTVFPRDRAQRLRKSRRHEARS